MVQPLSRRTYSTEILPGVHRVVLPLPGTKPGPVNAYVFVGENITLLDTGTAQAAPRLRRALLELGLDFADINRIVLTHGHVDHFGAARSICRACPDNPPQVLVHREDARGVETASFATRRTGRRYLLAMGLPLAYYLPLDILFFVLRSLAETCRVSGFLTDGQEIVLGSHPAVCMATPGHSQGSLCFYLPDHGALFSGDHILGHITPNALVMLDDNSFLPRRLSQEEFYASQEKTEALKPKIVFPGHSEPILDLEATANMYRQYFAEREGLILGILEKGPQTVYEIAMTLFSDKLGRGGSRRFSFDWLKKFSLEIYLSLSEVYSHLQVLEKKDLVCMERKKRRVLVSIRK